MPEDVEKIAGEMLERTSKKGSQEEIAMHLMSLRVMIESKKARGQWDDVIQLYHQAFEMDDGTNEEITEFLTPMYHSIVLTYQQLKKEKQLEKFVDAFLQREPKNAESWFQRGLILKITNRLEMAVDAFKACLKLNPFHAEALTGLKSTLVVIGEDTFRFMCPHCRASYDHPIYPVEMVTYTMVAPGLGRYYGEIPDSAKAMECDKCKGISTVVLILCSTCFDGYQTHYQVVFKKGDKVSGEDKLTVSKDLFMAIPLGCNSCMRLSPKLEEKSMKGRVLFKKMVKLNPQFSKLEKISGKLGETFSEILDRKRV
ncbi:MAG: hypothetical protein RTU92_04280 [Candidatus Thorarchaeota archaeon]